MAQSVTETRAINFKEIQQQNIKEILLDVEKALTESGYHAVNQIAGYLITNDPAYIPRYHNARTLIQEAEQYEIIEELVRSYLENNKK